MRDPDSWIHERRPLLAIGLLAGAVLLPELMPASAGRITSGLCVQVDIVASDGRLSMEREVLAGQAQRFDVLVIDAFNGDAIPVHLLTREAFALYLAELSPDGVLALHISNNYLDLQPVAARLARAFDLCGGWVHSRATSRLTDTSDWIYLRATLRCWGNPPYPPTSGRWRAIRAWCRGLMITAIFSGFSASRLRKKDFRSLLPLSYLSQRERR